MDEDAAPFALRPAALLVAVLAFLPADQRARAGAVSRAWRTASSDPEAWLEADLTQGGGVTCSHVDPLLLLPALAPKLARTRVLAVLPPPGPDRLEATLRCMLRLMREGGHLSALRELHLHGSLTVRMPGVSGCAEAVRELLAAAPALGVVELQLLAGDNAAAVALLPLRPRVRVRHFSWTGRFDQEDPPAVTSAQVLEQLERHDGLQALTVTDFRAGYATPELMPRLVDVALARQLEHVVFRGLQDAGAGYVAQLARLVRKSTTLRTLVVTDGQRCMELLPEALSVNTTLRELGLCNVRLWGRNIEDVGRQLCGALEGHPSLTSLSISCPNEANMDDASTDASLAALLAANAPALTALSLEFATVRTSNGVQLPRTLAALAHNSYLRTLTLGRLIADPKTLRGVVLPAVRANTALRHLRLMPHTSTCADARAALAEAEQLVVARDHGSSRS